MGLNKINIGAFVEKFRDNYEGLYEGRIKVKDYATRIKQGDECLYRFGDFVADFNRARQDILSSDREMVAFVLTLEDYGVDVA